MEPETDALAVVEEVVALDATTPTEGVAGKKATGGRPPKLVTKLATVSETSISAQPSGTADVELRPTPPLRVLGGPDADAQGRHGSEEERPLRDFPHKIKWRRRSFDAATSPGESTSSRSIAENNARERALMDSQNTGRARHHRLAHPQALARCEEGLPRGAALKH